jgi:VanZ family protein
MSNSRRGAAFWISTWGPVVLAIAVICLESTEAMGADHTSGPLHRLFEAIFGRIGEDSWNLIHHIVRKSGHFIGYGLVGLAWFRAWWRTFTSASYFRCMLFALLGTFLVASGDEWHQTFLPNRQGQFTDVLLDCTGSLVILSMTFLFLRVGHSRALLLREAASRRPN